METVTELYQDYKRACESNNLTPQSFEDYSSCPHVKAYLNYQNQFIDISKSTPKSTLILKEVKDLLHKRVDPAKILKVIEGES